MIQLEEKNRITNYLLAFTKIQRAISIIVRITKKKETISKYKAFIQFKATIEKKLDKEQIENVIKELRMSIKRLMRIKLKHKRFLLDRFLCNWRDNAARLKLLTKSSKELSNVEAYYKKELNTKDKIIKGLEQKFKQQIVEVSELKETEKVLKQTLKEKEKQERSLKESTNTKLIQNKLQALEKYVMKLETENKNLKDQLELAEKNVGGFLKEVNEIINSSELLSIFLYHSR